MASRDIRKLTPFLQRVFIAHRAWYARYFRYRTLILTCTLRGKKEQKYEYASGRTRRGAIKTYCDGVRNKSNHNYTLAEGGARAYDFAVVIRGKARWDKKYFNSCWLFFRQAHLTRKIRWGRDFKSFKDYPHIEETKYARNKKP